MRKLKLAGVLILLTLFAVSMGCASFDKNVVQTLSITAAAQDAGGHSIAYLYHTGKISEENWQDFKKYNDRFVVVHKETVDGLTRYRLTKTPGDKSKLEILLNDLMVLSETVSKIVINLTKKVEN